MNADTAILSCKPGAGWSLLIRWEHWRRENERVVVGPFDLWTDLRDAVLAEYDLDIADMTLPEGTYPADVIENMRRTERMNLIQSDPVAAV